MKKTYKKIIAASLAATAITGVLSGCGGKKENSDNAGEVKEISAFLYMYMADFSPEMPIWKAAEEKTGIRLKNVASSSAADMPTALSTVLVGKKLPDIINAQNESMRDIAEDGGLVPLDDYLEEYAPNITEYFEKAPEAKNLGSASDGHIYFIPGSLSGPENSGSPAQGFFIRQDWLDKLGLEAPKTIDEYYNVLSAFKTQDPNGNGIADEIPYFGRTMSIDPLLKQFFCTGNEFEIENGALVFGPTSENYKLAMNTLAKWYGEGLIDNEIFTRNSAREQLLGQNIGGATNDWFSSTSKFNDTLKDSVPGFNFVVMMPPENINGVVENRMVRSKLSGYGWGISKDADEDDIIDIVKFFDFWMSEEGRMLMARGVEGVSYTVGENGELEWTEEALSYTDGIPAYLRSIGTMEVGTCGDIEIEKLGMNEIGQKGFEMYEDIGYESIPTLIFTDEEQDVISKNYTNIKTYVAEQQQKYLFGTEAVDATWDSYVKTLKDMGLDDVVKVYNAAYKRAVE